MTDLPHLAARLYGAPLLIARPKLETILAAIGPRLLGLGPLPAATEAAAAPEPHITEDGIAVLPILGTLVHRSAYLGAASGLQSYLEIETQAEALFADPRARAVVLEIDSAGGEAACARSLLRAASSCGRWQRLRRSQQPTPWRRRPTRSG